MVAVRGGLSVVAVLLATGTAAAQAVRATTFAEVMRRAHAYVAVYEDHQLSSLIAREEYHQQSLHPDERVRAERTLLSDYMLFQLPPKEDWFALRDVHEVNGKPVADRDVRLKMLFTEPRNRVEELAMAIDQESARFNLGDVPRTVNLPTFALRFLRPANRKRFDFKKEAEERVGDAVTWVVGYRETDSPTFSATIEGKDVAASGRFWIDPESGAVLRTEMILGGTRGVPQRMTVTVTYDLEPSLGFRVPIEMRERYDNPRKKRQDIIVGRATYSAFRPFDWRSLR
ncbi:MAG: hypothetical protein ACRD2A_03630 [Vicinamibacterales bacterium]